jgi:hypothetical protein
MIERRREVRSRTLLHGKIVLNDRQSALDCAVRNVSPHGALVQLPMSFAIPREFGFDIPHRSESHEAKVVWRRPEGAGLALVPREQEEARPVKKQLRMTQREKQVALKRLLDRGIY